jgi:hypothetical protein
VVPFRNSTAKRDAGDIVADKVAAALAANGTYEVFNRNDLKARMDERDLQIAFSDDANAAAQAFRKVGKVQAILVGNVTTYSSNSQRQQRQDPTYYTDAKGNRRQGAPRRYTYTQNFGDVSVAVTLIRVSDGSPIHATPAASRNCRCEGEAPALSEQACLEGACNAVIAQLLEEFAVVPKQITVDPKQAFTTASDFYDAKFTYSDSFRAGDPQMLVVLALPTAADRNNFRVTIVREGARQDLFEQDLIWSGKNSSIRIPVKPADLAAKGGGPGWYVAKLYSGPQPVLTQRFQIRQ